MEKYDAILRTINDKIADQEGIIKMYRKEAPEKDATIRQLKLKVAELEKALSESGKHNALLKEAYDEQRDELDDYKVANQALKDEIHKLSKF